MQQKSKLQSFIFTAVMLAFRFVNPREDKLLN